MKGEVSNLHEIKNDSYGRRGAIDQDEVHVAARKAEASRLADFIKALPFDRKSGDRGSVSFMAREENTTAASRKVTIEGRIYDLSHLDPFAFEFVVPEKVGRPPQIYAIDVQFSWHCFTRGIAAGENFPGTLAYSHGRETRLFDERRYRFSRQLPSIIRDIGSRKCFHTGKGNFFTVEFIDENGSAVEYAIFFKMSRRGKRGELLLMVESAYAQDNRVPRGRPHPPRPIRFSVIAYNTATGKPIKQPK